MEQLTFESYQQAADYRERMQAQGFRARAVPRSNKWIVKVWEKGEKRHPDASGAMIGGKGTFNLGGAGLRMGPKMRSGLYVLKHEPRLSDKGFADVGGGSKMGFADIGPRGKGFQDVVPNRSPNLPGTVLPRQAQLEDNEY